jgi:hypothetical protein
MFIHTSFGPPMFIGKIQNASFLCFESERAPDPVRVSFEDPVENVSCNDEHGIHQQKHADVRE